MWASASRAILPGAATAALRDNPPVGDVTNPDYVDLLESLDFGRHLTWAHGTKLRDDEGRLYTEELINYLGTQVDVLEKKGDAVANLKQQPSVPTLLR